MIIELQNQQLRKALLNQASDASSPVSCFTLGPPFVLDTQQTGHKGQGLPLILSSKH